MSGSMKGFLHLVALCVRGRGGGIGLVYFLIVLALGLVGVQITVRLIKWTADFYNALQALNVDEAVRQIGIFFGLIGISASLFLVGAFIRKLLQLRWRRTLTEAALNAWMSDKTYWRLRFAQSDLDNPDQRIAEDCRIFVDKLTSEALELITNVVALVSYVTILWNLSTFPLSFTLGGAAVEIPRYMVWAAPIYVALASGLTHLLGKPLTGLAFEQQRREGDFRFALARLRENVEAVALMGGESAERATLRDRFERVARNWKRLAGRELILGCFTRPYMQSVLRIPLFLALPAYLAGKVTFGGLMQLSSAFQNVVTTLSWFIFSYKDLAELAAASRRLSKFLDEAERAGRNWPTQAAGRDSEEDLTIEGLTLRAPCGQSIIHVPRLELTPGGAYWLVGPSGYGKSTLLKSIAGLWPVEEGRIVRPSATAFFTSQQVYIPLGDLATALAYPRQVGDLSAADVRQALTDVGLGNLADLDADAWALARDRLSGGERQRLAIARLILQSPDWVFLDEATSALDRDAEEHLFSTMRTRMPNATFIVVAHRTPKGLGEITKIVLNCARSRSHLEADRKLAPLHGVVQTVS